MKSKKIFKNREELLKFVLEECGDISYYCSDKNNHRDYFELDINRIVVLDYLYYTYQLMKEQFGKPFDGLALSGCQIRTLPNDFFERMPDIKKFWCSDNRLLKLPPLPKNLISLIADNNNLSELPELPNTISVICQSQ